MYEKRLCAFIDILGFRDLVQQSVKSPFLYNKIRDLLREVGRARPIWERDNPVDIIESRLRQQGVQHPKAEANRLIDEYSSAERGTSFSDSIVLSAALNDHAITGFFTSLLFLSEGIAELGKYVRGAVCLGELCHEPDICFGPALITAYDLEKNAEYPRIIFSSETYMQISKVSLPSVGSLASFIREDADGQRFLDFLNKKAFELAGDFRTDQMNEIRRGLNNQLFSSQVSNRVRKKLEWLAGYFNLTLKEEPIVGIDPLSTDFSNKGAV